MAEAGVARRGEGPAAFVAGWPIGHSRSPLIHGWWLRELGIKGSYEPVGIPPEKFSGFLGEIGSNGFVGGNVTIPHKVAAFEAVARRDASAEAIGAVNTLWLEGGRLVGGNTDAHGFCANLDERLAGWSDAGTAVVIGAGGAARAVIHALILRGVSRVTILNRTAERAEALAESFGPNVAARPERERGGVLAAADLLVNTAPVASRDAPPDLSALPDHALVTDIVYAPLMTPTLRAAEARGLKTADGLGMLLHQAAPGFERWFGLRPTVSEALRAAVVRDLEREAAA